MFEAAGFTDMIYRTCEVPASGAIRSTCTQAVPLCRYATFPPPRGGIVPRTPEGHPFLLEEKDAKDHSGGVCGLPLKTPG